MALGATPVIVAGETHYRGKGFTIDVESKAGLIDAIDEALAGGSPLSRPVARNVLRLLRTSQPPFPAE